LSIANTLQQCDNHKLTPWTMMGNKYQSITQHCPSAEYCRCVPFTCHICRPVLHVNVTKDTDGTRHTCNSQMYTASLSTTLPVLVVYYYQPQPAIFQYDDNTSQFQWRFLTVAIKMPMSKQDDFVGISGKIVSLSTDAYFTGGSKRRLTAFSTQLTSYRAPLR